MISRFNFCLCKVETRVLTAAVARLRVKAAFGWFENRRASHSRGRWFEPRRSRQYLAQNHTLEKTALGTHWAQTPQGRLDPHLIANWSTWRSGASVMLPESHEPR